MRLFNFALPALLATSAAIPTIPTIRPIGPPTTGIVAAADGTVYFVDSFHRTVWRVSKDGEKTAFVTGTNGKSLQIDEHGNIYGTHEADRGQLILWRADPAGNVIEIGRTAVPEHHGHAFVLDDGGDVIGWTGNGKRTGVRVWRARDRERHLLAGGEWGLRDGAGANARFFPIGAMVQGEDGTLYVTSGPTIRRIAQDGAVTTVAKGEKLLTARGSLLSRLLGEVQGHLTGIALDCDGTIYVANTARDAVIRVEPGGKVTEVVTTDGSWTPTGVAVSERALYVLEYGPGVRVRKIDVDGGATIVAIVRTNRAVAAHPFSLKSLFS